MSSLNKMLLAQQIEEHVGLEMPQAMELVERFIEIVSNGLTYNEKIKLTGLGSLSVRQKKSRMARNPKTGEPVMINARRVVQFIPSVGIKNRLRQGKSS